MKVLERIGPDRFLLKNRFEKLLKKIQREEHSQPAIQDSFKIEQVKKDIDIGNFSDSKDACVIA